MGAEDSVGKLKRKKISKKREERSEMESSHLAQIGLNVHVANEKNKKKNKKRKKSSVDIENKVGDVAFVPSNTRDETHEASGGNKRSKHLTHKRKKNGKITRTRTDELATPLVNEIEDRRGVADDQGENKLQKSRKKNWMNIENVNKIDESINEEDALEQNEEMAWATHSKPDDHVADSEALHDADTRKSSRTGKLKKSSKSKKKGQFSEKKLSEDSLLEKIAEDPEDEVYQMSSGDEDYSKGMKKWITQYHQSRPGLKVLQERIDKFIIDLEAKEEQARAEREAQAAEGGWTVVVQHKGRKKTTDAESGIAVGSVAQAAVLDKITKKKKNEIDIDFYRFQKREAQRNEIMMLQSKFEQDKKRIQEMRAARKFRPY